MGIINLTPDSFYGASRHDVQSEVERSIERSVTEGATIIDLGAYSSRPGAADVDVEEEWRRLKMGLQAARSVSSGVVLSIDTFRADIVRRAADEYGDIIVNDITAGEADPEILDEVVRRNLIYVAMHMRGTPQTMQGMTEYPRGVVAEVKEYFASRLEYLESRGIARDKVILDPGFGFAKSVTQNYELMQGLDELCALGCEVLCGVSRKSMIYKPLGITPEEALPGSLAMAWEALRGGAKILRVHDVAATRQIVDLYNLYMSVR